ncbi:phage portal protein [Lacticaseibacillus paracasei]|uniref:phage portal protein n=1 Tax=Lacticaseibacillus paracasei TaxID=1597 RepID=UPI0021A398A1|nr:phage portal protein [Lacticaseibacillus paracasei]MCT4383919.1 phage portal protein [Lacticaseibacillus paracasei]
MKLFRGLATEVDPHWADHLLDSGVIPSFRGGYLGISALRNSDVLTAVSIVSGDVSRFPLVITDSSTDEVVDLANIEYLMNTKVNKRLSAYQWKFSMMVNAILTGNAYSRIVRDPITNEPAMFEFYAPSQTQVDTSDPENLVYRFMPYNSSMQKICGFEDVIHWKFFSYDTIMGRSPLLSLGDEIGLQESGVSTLQKFFKSGLKGSILKAKASNLSAEARRKMREDFERAQAGADAGSPIIVDSTMDYQPLEVDTNVLNLINSNNYSTAQIAKALRVPAYRLAQNSPNQSVKQLADDYIRNDLPFYFEPITSEFELKLLDDAQRHQYCIGFDTKSVNGLPIADVNTAVNGGLWTGNEGRAELGKKPLKDPNMDRIQSTLNTVFLDQKAAYQSEHAAELKGGDTNAKGNQNGSGTNANS